MNDLSNITPELNRAALPLGLLRDEKLRGTIAIPLYSLLLLRRDLRVRDMALYFGVTERSITRNLTRLEQQGWLERSRDDSKCNSYSFPRQDELAEAV